MLNKNVVIAFAVRSLFAGALWANTNKACLKTANMTYKSDIAACKELKGAEKKSCKKTAKENRTQAKAACKASPAQ